MARQPSTWIDCDEIGLTAGGSNANTWQPSMVQYIHWKCVAVLCFPVCSNGFSGMWCAPHVYRSIWNVTRFSHVYVGAPLHCHRNFTCKNLSVVGNCRQWHTQKRISGTNVNKFFFRVIYQSRKMWEYRDTQNGILIALLYDGVVCGLPALSTYMKTISNRAGTPPTIDFGAPNYKQRGTSNN